MKRLFAWLKRGAEFYLLIFVLAAVFWFFLSFGYSKPWHRISYSLELSGAVLSIYVVWASYNRHSTAGLFESILAYIKEFPLFQRKWRRASPGGEILKFELVTVDASPLEFRGVEKGNWEDINERLKTLYEGINNDRFYLGELEKKSTKVGEKVLNDVLPMLNLMSREQKKEQINISRLMLVAFLWIIIGILVGGVPLLIGDD